MATLVLSAAGAALGGSLGGSLAGLSMLTLGQAAGAALGSVIDQKVMGLGSEPVETGRIDRLRVMGSSEGVALPRAFGRNRLSGQLIWSSRFRERVNEEEVGGKGGGGGATVREYSYSISVAVALCEGVVHRIGRIWADGQVLDQSGLTWRLHHGSGDQMPDPLIAAVEGDGNAPAYRGTAYVVFENLDLTPFGNRIPQFSFEVFRRPDRAEAEKVAAPQDSIRGVALVPGTGEYALATDPVYFRRGRGESSVVNVHNDRGLPDFVASLDQLQAELPNAKAVSLVVTWFGDDLRCDRCRLRPAVEQVQEDGDPIAWRVSGQARDGAHVVGRVDGRPVFGGTPADRTVVQAIRHMNDAGQRVMFYPFILMDILAGNGLRDPWSGAADQPVIPWRGRITLKRAPGTANSADRTEEARQEVAAFFGEARATDFEIGDATVGYRGPAEWSYRRFILHYAHLCKLAGNIDAFCIGSELRSLTQIRDGAASYPAVRELRRLAEDVRGILGPDVRIGYAADWSEYFGHQPADGSGDVLYHLDPLWAHPDIDFVGIDNYMPLSDWRDGSEHADAAAGSIYNLDYLTANVAGGEGYDWFYADATGREAQDRLPIQDGAYGEDWVFRYKDLVNWWSRPHVNRLAGVKAQNATDWVPGSKPIWFTELGCPAVDKGTNQPNVFHDPKSSESFFPYHSDGGRDDFIQYRYLQAMHTYWTTPANNPVSNVYGGTMVDMDHSYVWAWDARPWPDFPSRSETWIDGANYPLGHWLNGRSAMVSLGSVVSEVCARAGLVEIDTDDLHGLVTGFGIGAVEPARSSLQPLMLAFGFDAFMLDGLLAFRSRGGSVATTIDVAECVVSDGAVITRSRSPEAETAGRVTLGFVRGDRDYASGAVEALAPDAAEASTAQSSLPVVMSEAEALAIAERWLAEGQVARDSLDFSLPPSSLRLGPGDMIAASFGDRSDLFRIDRVEELGLRRISAARIEPDLYRVTLRDTGSTTMGRVVDATGPVFALFLDLPLLTGSEIPDAPHLAVTGKPWRGPVAVYAASGDYGYRLKGQVERPAVIGETLGPLPRAEPGRWMNADLGVRVNHGMLQSRSESDVLNGANVAALRHGSDGDWEVIQFRDAVLEAPDTYRLSGLLRGQAGTEWVQPRIWPAGTDFVLLNGVVGQIGLPAAARGLERHYRIGSAAKPYDDPSYLHEVHAFDGVGLRPYAPTHLQVRREADGTLAVGWTRRTRIDGDSWQGSDVPLGEERETYHLRVLDGSGGVLREFSPSESRQAYSAAQQQQDGATGLLTFEVAQVSARFGPGPYERITFDA